MMNIDPEFRDLIPPLSAEEFAGLEASILAQGCRTPLDVWGDTLIDGHHRHTICTQHSIPFETKPIHFEDRDAALDWITNNQAVRRNLTRDQRTMLIGRTYLRRKNQHGGDRKSKGQNVPLNTAEVVGKEFGVSDRTVKRAAEMVTLLENHPDLLDAVARGTMKLADAAREARGQLISLTIDPEFAELLPPLTFQEFDGLITNIRTHGCLDRICVWNGIILDGHQRYRICHKYGIPFRTVEIELGGRSEAKLWIMRQQLGRKNLSLCERIELAIALDNEGALEGGAA